MLEYKLPVFTLAFILRHPTAIAIVLEYKGFRRINDRVYIFNLRCGTAAFESKQRQKTFVCTLPSKSGQSSEGKLKIRHSSCPVLKCKHKGAFMLALESRYNTEQL